MYSGETLDPGGLQSSRAPTPEGSQQTISSWHTLQDLLKRWQQKQTPLYNRDKQLREIWLKHSPMPQAHFLGYDSTQNALLIGVANQLVLCELHFARHDLLQTINAELSALGLDPLASLSLRLRNT